MLIELAALKYLLSGGTSDEELSSSDSKIEIPSATRRSDAFSIFFLTTSVPAIIGLIFSNYTALESIGCFMNWLMRQTVGAVTEYRSRTDLTDFGTVVIPVLFVIWWVMIFGTIVVISRYFAALITEMGKMIPKGIKNFILVITISISISCIYYGYNQYHQKRSVFEKEEKREKERASYRHSRYYF